MNKKEIKKANNREYYLRNKETIKANVRTWQCNNKDKVKAYKRKNNLTESTKLKKKEWEKNNLHKKRLYTKKKRETDPRFKLSGVIRCLMNSRLRARAISKLSKNTFDCLYFTLDEFMAEMESKFLPGMSWNNHGKWHIDHKKPDSSFNYKSVGDDDFKECWKLSNLQPLWARDNIKKSNIIIK